MADGNDAAGAAGAGTDAELIRGLQEALAVEQAKNQVLMEQLVKAEDALADKDLEGYADVVEEADRPFWRGQLLDRQMVPSSYLRDDGRVEVAKFDWSEDIRVTNSAAVVRLNVTAS